MAHTVHQMTEKPTRNLLVLGKFSLQRGNQTPVLKEALGILASAFVLALPSRGLFPSGGFWRGGILPALNLSRGKNLSFKLHVCQRLRQKVNLTAQPPTYALTNNGKSPFLSSFL